jgi:hypothetical protein
LLWQVVDNGNNKYWEAYDAVVTSLFKRGPMSEHPYLDHCDGLGTCPADNMHVFYLGWQVQDHPTVCALGRGGTQLMEVMEGLTLGLHLEITQLPTVDCSPGDAKATRFG